MDVVSTIDNEVGQYSEHASETPLSKDRLLGRTHVAIAPDVHEGRLPD